MAIFLPESQSLREKFYSEGVEKFFPSEEDWGQSFHFFSSSKKIQHSISKRHKEVEKKIREIGTSSHRTVAGLLLTLAVICVIALLSVLIYFVIPVSLSSNIFLVMLPILIILVVGSVGMGLLIHISLKKNIFTNKATGFSSGKLVIPIVLGGASLSNEYLEYIRSDNKSSIRLDKPPLCKLFYGFRYLDISHLDENKSGLAPCYLYVDHNRAMSLAFLGTPFYCFGVMIYNIFRTLIIPFYILYRIIIHERNQKVFSDPIVRFRFADIPREICRSLFYFFRAPFYAAALIIALGYSLIRPIQGRILVGTVEREWNDGIPKGWNFLQQKEELLFEGGGARLNLGKNSFYLAGCCQPDSLFLFKDGKIVSGSRAHLVLGDPGIQNVFSYPFVCNNMSSLKE